MEGTRMRKTLWAKSGNGPDSSDVATAMRAIEGMHGVYLSLVVSPVGEYGEGGLEVTCVATKTAGSNGGAASSVSRKRRFPSGNQVTLEGLMLSLVYEIDMDCGTFWEQARLPEA
jgi:hypothetical protein